MSLESKTLRYILEQVNADTKYTEYASLQSELEWYAKHKIEEYQNSQRQPLSQNYPNEEQPHE